MNYANALLGNCHCENIQFTLSTNKSLQEFVPRNCSCTLCKRHAASYISDPQGHVSLEFKDRDLVSFYRFGHGTSDFIICRRCGVLVLALCEIEGRTRAVINRMSMLQYTFSAAPVTTNFDAETVEERLSRRARNWTGRVTVVESTAPLPGELIAAASNHPPAELGAFNV